MKQEVKIGQTDYTVLVLIRDTAGAPKTALTNASAGLDVCYTRVETDNDVVLADGAPVALATPALTDVHLDWGFLEVDATKAPGLYRLDIADGVFATGAWSAVVSLIGTGLDPTHLEFVLVPDAPYTGVNVSQISNDATAADNLELACDNYSATRGLTGTAVPAAAADAAGGLAISDAGGLDLDAKLANTNEVTAARMGALTDWIDGGRLDLLIDAIVARLPSLTVTTGTVLTSGGNNTASAFYTDLPGGDGFWNDALILMTSGALAGQIKEIGDFADTNGVVTVADGKAFTATPADGVTFAVINR